MNEVADRRAGVALEAEADVRNLDLPVLETRQDDCCAVGEGKFVAAFPGLFGEQWKD